MVYEPFGFAVTSRVEVVSAVASTCLPLDFACADASTELSTLETVLAVGAAPARAEVVVVPVAAEAVLGVTRASTTAPASAPATPPPARRIRKLKFTTEPSQADFHPSGGARSAPRQGVWPLVASGRSLRDIAHDRLVMVVQI
jgi:hypothetical protein